MEEINDARRALPEHVFKELYLAEPSDDGANPFGVEAIGNCVGMMSHEAPVVYGVDLAKSVDYTVIIGLDRDGRVASFKRFQLPWDKTRAQILSEIKGTRALVDSTGVGDPIVEELQKAANV